MSLSPATARDVVRSFDDARAVDAIDLHVAVAFSESSLLGPQRRRPGGTAELFRIASAVDATLRFVMVLGSRLPLEADRSNCGPRAVGTQVECLAAADHASGLATKI